ncbi:hypothetical protein [Pseudomonas syringae]|uniref:hypothetical protein n=2 Tax=Pseudomonas syringae TaxID=317 RepID=UPI00087C6616|nr:hypothetical protein [Pseudomonas syringae]MCK9697857.1 hypothetical protein [Pseudomonas syringae pv. syringae]SDS79772.1 hypothetical protein SAMN05421724_2232 [Pseudomonas syringae]SFW84651.1 hypothetical protein SAMN03159505_04367 [Pseudomonas sp. NFACC10-1]
MTQSVMNGIPTLEREERSLSGRTPSRPCYAARRQELTRSVMNGIATLEREERSLSGKTLSCPCSAWACRSGRSASSSEQAALYDKRIASALA